MGLELRIVAAEVVQLFVGLKSFGREAQGGVVEAQQLRNTHVAAGAGQIQRPMTHVVLKCAAIKRESHEKKELLRPRPFH